ncbi:MAG: HTTM domain-containing protein [Planctomycetia bacterium]|nr:HTTM domain-containing protein [Planctomycetia bacterium]
MEKTSDQYESNPSMKDMLFKPIDIAWLAAFRIITGGLLCYEMVRYLANGWLKSYYIETPMHFKFYGFSWVEQLPQDWMMYCVFLLLIMSSICVTLGYRYRISSVIQFLGFTYLFLLDAAGYRNHWYLLCLLCLFLVFLPAHRAFSLDCGRIKDLQRNWCQQWQLWLIRSQLVIVYFFAGIAKFDHGWLSGESIRAIFTSEGHSPETLNFLFRDDVTQFFVWSGLLFDLTIPFFLLWKRTRFVAFVGAATFHLTNGMFLVSVGIFPWFMLMAGALFFDPDWPRVLLRKMGFASGASVPIPESPSGLDDPQIPRPVILGLLTIYLAFQILLPLRHHLYDSYASWSHEGHRWAWRMKLVNKRVEKVQIFSFDPNTGTRITLDPNYKKALVLWQQSRVAQQPDLFIQFAKDLSYKLEAQTGKHYPIHANVEISINGNPVASLYDPSVDLSQVQWSLAPKSWLTPYSDR